MVQLNSATVTTLSRRDTNNIRGILFGFINQFVLFSCEWSDVPVSNHQLTTRSLFTRGLKSPRVETFCAVTIRLPRCVVSATWGLLFIADGGDCHEFFTTDARWVLVAFAHFLTISGSQSSTDASACRYISADMAMMPMYYIGNIPPIIIGPQKPLRYCLAWSVRKPNCYFVSDWLVQSDCPAAFWQHEVVYNIQATAFIRLLATHDCKPHTMVLKN